MPLNMILHCVLNATSQVKWSRFVMHGLPGHYISANLHMEHLNKESLAIELSMLTSKTKPSNGQQEHSLSS